MRSVRFGLLFVMMMGCSVPRTTQNAPAPEDLVETGSNLYIFVTHECPIANRYAPELCRIAEEHLDLVGSTVVVYADPSASVAACRTHFEQYYASSFATEKQSEHLPVLMVHDARHFWVKKFDAKAVPTAVISRGEAVLYHGRIDDRNPRLGARRVQAGQQDLREALAALRAGTLTPTRTRVVGCSIDRTAG